MAIFRSIYLVSTFTGIRIKTINLKLFDIYRSDSSIIRIQNFENRDPGAKLSRSATLKESTVKF